LFLQSREQVAVERGHIRRIGWAIKDLEPQVGLFLLNYQFLVSRGSFVQKQDHTVDLTALISFKMSFKYTRRE
jgi:hypothetical protein